MFLKKHIYINFLCKILIFNGNRWLPILSRKVIYWGVIPTSKESDLYF